MDNPGGTRYLMFETGGRRYACTLDSVREIVPIHTATRLPGAPASVVGLINLRGRLVTVIDLAAHLGARDARPARGASGSVILVGTGSRQVGMLVDEVRDVRPVEPDAVERMHDTDAAAGDGPLRALVRLDDGVAAVLEPEAILSEVLQ
jgi:purine-binding chemotaxis protein CheW